MSITASQVKEARRLLGWSQEMVGGLAGLSRSSIRKIENDSPFLQDETRQRVRAALEAAGVIFVEENGEGLGVRLREVAK